MTGARSRKILFGCASLFLFAVVMSCGYAFAPQGENIDPSIRTVYVEPFSNKTAQAELENDLRTAFIDQILQNTRFKIVSDPHQADALLSGAVLQFNTAALSYRKTLLAAEERATVTLEVVFRETRSGKTIWSSRVITDSVDYKLEDDINLLSATRRTALTKLARDTAEKTLTLMLSNF
jgi:hypothetical protein